MRRVFPQLMRTKRWRGPLGMVGMMSVVLALALGLAACGGPSRTSGATSTQAITVPVKVLQGPMGATQILLPVTINGHGPFTFPLDTGASTSVIDAPLAQQLGLPQTGAPIPVTGVAAQSTEIPVRAAQARVQMPGPVTDRSSARVDTPAPVRALSRAQAWPLVCPLWAPPGGPSIPAS